MDVKYSCVILGSSGETGRELISKLVSNDSINEVVCINRRYKKEWLLQLSQYFIFRLKRLQN